MGSRSPVVELAFYRAVTARERKTSGSGTKTRFVVLEFWFRSRQIAGHYRILKTVARMGTVAKRFIL